MIRKILAGATLATAILLSACAPKAPPPPPPPPPKVVIPSKPWPPSGASPNLVTPPLDSAGLRQSPVRGTSENVTTWNLRSAYNVAALNCNGPEYADMIPNYRAFLNAHTKTLAAVNKAVDEEFRAKHGTRFIPVRETYMTQVYNHFALPPVLPEFCRAVAAVARDAQLVKSVQLKEFAVRALPNIEIVYDDFYRRYDQYRADLTAWESRYGHLYAAPARAQ